jgi:hypothetical protein
MTAQQRFGYDKLANELMERLRLQDRILDVYRRRLARQSIRAGACISACEGISTNDLLELGTGGILRAIDDTLAAFPRHPSATESSAP